jgi:hypothetical protein
VKQKPQAGSGVRSRRNPPLPLHELKAGNAVYLDAVLNNTPCPAELVATSALTLLTMDADQFRTLVAPWRDEMLLIAASERLSSNNAHLPINFKDLDFRRIIGIGMFGQVRMVVHRYTGVVYAMKCISKSLLIEHGQQQHVENERTVVQQTNVRAASCSQPPCPCEALDI